MKEFMPRFYCIPLGVDGGINEANASAYLVAPLGSTAFACLDVGTLWSGLQVACQNGCFLDIAPPTDSGLTPEGHVLHNHIRAYLVTHAFLDHVSGLAMISPEDTQKPILALQSVINDLRDHIFNWHTWPNFADQGTKPLLGKYRYLVLPEGQQVAIPGTEMKVTVYPLAHGVNNGGSSAFLIEADGYHALYMGDTGPDEIESSCTTHNLWQAIVPLIRKRRLCGIFIEASYCNSRPDDLLYSHLTPAWVMKAFRRLARLTDSHNPERALDGLNVIITHVKPSLKSNTKQREVIMRELISENDLGLNLIFAEQGKRFEF